MEFRIIGPGADELHLLKQLPKAYKGNQLFRSEVQSAVAEFGELVFQHFTGEDFEIWYSNYSLKHPASLMARGDIPLLELHIQFQNQFNIEWDGYGKNTLRAYQYNLTYTPFLLTKVNFQGGKRYETFDIFFKQEYLEKVSPSCVPLTKFLELVNKKQPASLTPDDRFLTPEMISIVVTILKCDFNDRLNHFYIECKVKELLLLMLNHIEEEPDPSPLKLSTYDIECLHEAKTILLHDFEEKLSLKDLSRKAAINEFKLKQGFKYLFGEPVFTYRNSARMEKAKLILKDTKLPIHDLAFMLGFEYPENFQKAFKRYWGVTPAEVRKGK